ncbi:hypothetical protein KC356_g252 [Hortaea werneckii]|nr:hypothetical protein KC356_g252 [Hortaea werneckii]
MTVERHLPLWSTSCDPRPNHRNGAWFLNISLIVVCVDPGDTNFNIGPLYATHEALQISKDSSSDMKVKWGHFRNAEDSTATASAYTQAFDVASGVIAVKTKLCSAVEAGDRDPEVHVRVMWSELADAWTTDLTLLPTANMMGGEVGRID